MNLRVQPQGSAQSRHVSRAPRERNKVAGKPARSFAQASPESRREIVAFGILKGDETMNRSVKSAGRRQLHRRKGPRHARRSHEGPTIQARLPCSTWTCLSPKRSRNLPTTWVRADLVIFFKSGGVYEYQDVPRTVFDGFRAAQSKGEFFQSAIRDSVYFAAVVTE